MRKDNGLKSAVGSAERLHPPPPVLEIAHTLTSAGYESWCVGGAVRDALLGHTNLDWDLATSATPAQGGWLINGVKTWCTFGARGDVLMLLARTDPDRTIGHKGLSMFIVPKLRGSGHGFEVHQNDIEGPGAGKMEGRPIDTIGYRGMHSYEVAFDNWFVPADNLIGGDDGLGHPHLELGRGAEAGAATELRPHRLEDDLRGVAQDHRPP